MWYPEEVEVGEHFRTSYHIIVCAGILLKVRIPDGGIRRLDIMKANFEGMYSSSMFCLIPPKPS